MKYNVIYNDIRILELKKQKKMRKMKTFGKQMSEYHKDCGFQDKKVHKFPINKSERIELVS